MNELLPGSIADERFQRLDRVAAARFAGIDLSRALVALIDQVEASALPALGWQFGAIDEAWRVATVPERRELLKRVMARRRKRGTPWAVRDAVEALGHDATVRERTSELQVRNGSVPYNGNFFHHSSPWCFWVVVTGVRGREVLQAVVDRWKRKATRAAVYFIADNDDAAYPVAYSVTADTHVRIFDPTFGLTFG